MGSFANSLFKIMLGWLQAVVSAVWSAFTNQNGNSLFNWIGKHWILIAGVLCVTGLAADLCVYILRWKPYKVWRSFFTGKGAEKELTEEENEPHIPVKGNRPVPESSSYDQTEQSKETRYGVEHSADFSRWAPEPDVSEQTDVKPAAKAVSVTSAGYVVPADSPYRRPAGAGTTGTVPETEKQSEVRRGREDTGPIVPRRRKRINVTELFTDPEEDVRQFDAPQHVIDSNKAYRDPVYPRGWNKSEDDGL